jgi:ferritin-like metal-binding protein YciE
MPITSSEQKFVHELADMYDAEHQFLEAMGKMREAASDAKLQTMLEEHIQQTEEQITKLEQVFSEVGKQPERQQCMGAKGLIEEATKIMQEAGSPEIRDAVIAGAVTKAEHYEMVSYADLIDGAEMMKKRKAVKLLTENRQQEVSTARKLERIAPRLGKAAA